MTRQTGEDWDGFDQGPTDFDGDEVLVVTGLPGGAAAVVPRSLERLDGESKVLMAAVMRKAAEINEMHAQLSELVAEARERGVSWAGIGWAVGTTGEAARQRWGIDRS